MNKHNKVFDLRADKNITASSKEFFN